MFCLGSILPGPGPAPSTGLAGSPSIRAPVSYLATEGSPICPWPFQLLLGSQAEFTVKPSQENHHHPDFTEDRPPTALGLAAAQAQLDIQLFRYRLRETAK